MTAAPVMKAARGRPREHNASGGNKMKAQWWRRAEIGRCRGEWGDVTMEYKDVYTACDREHRRVAGGESEGILGVHRVKER